VRTPRSDSIQGNIRNLKGEVSLQLILLGLGPVTELRMTPINEFGKLRPNVWPAQRIDSAMRMSELFHV
jgi:hypothetical protein